MDILCVHSDDLIRDIIVNELADLNFSFECHTSLDDVDSHPYVLLIEFKDWGIINRFPNTLVIPLVKTTDSQISYELEERGIEYITTEGLKNFKQKFMKILLNNKERLKPFSDEEKFLKNIIYAYGFGWGGMYIVGVDKIGELYGFIAKVPDGISIFIASREKPRRALMKRRNIRYVWVTDILGRDRIKPHNLTVLTDMLIRFLEEENMRIVVMDCVEYLLLYNNFLDVLRNIELINSYAMEYNSLIILIIDEDAYSRRDLSLLKRYAKKWNGGV